MSADETRPRPRPGNRPATKTATSATKATPGNKTALAGKATPGRTTTPAENTTSSKTTAVLTKARPAPKSDDPSAGSSPRRTLPSLPRWALPGAIALLVVLLVLDIILFLRYRDGEDAQQAFDARTSQSVAGTYSAALQNAKTKVPLILSYNYKTIDADIAKIGTALTGSFKSDYTTVLSQRVKPRAVQLKVTTKSTQSGAAVVNATSASTVSVLVFVNQQTTSAGGTPQVVGSRVQVTMKKVGSQWLISDLAVV